MPVPGELSYPEYLVREDSAAAQRDLEMYLTGLEDVQLGDMDLNRLSLTTPTEELDFSDFFNIVPNM